VLQLDQVSAGIAGVSVLRGISTRLAPGATVAIIGRNGAGKTTLLRAIMGLVPLQGGRALLAGQDLASIPPHKRTSLGIGYAPEDRVLFPTFTVEENLRFPCGVMHMARPDIDRRMQEVLAIVPELEPMLKRSGAALSGGQGKIAVLGRALMVGTRLVLLDEPFQGLAPVLAARYAESLNRMHEVRPDLCIAITESNRSLLRDIPTMTLQLERGALVMNGTKAASH
jgi:branched-chain amino acid transport system ATP-binding protein